MENEMVLLAIDPGNNKSGYVILSANYETFFVDGEKRQRPTILDFGKEYNHSFILKLNERLNNYKVTNCIIEKIQGTGQKAGKELFDTAMWSGRYYEKCLSKLDVIMACRTAVKGHLKCRNDSEIIQYLTAKYEDLEQYGKYGKGTDNRQGYFYGFKEDIWQAYALAIYALEKKRVLF